MIAAATLVVLSVTLLEQPETVEAAPVAAAAPQYHAVSVPAFLGPVGLSFGHSPGAAAREQLERAPARASRAAVRPTRKVREVVRVAGRPVERKAAPAARRSSSSTRATRPTSSVRHQTARKVNKSARFVNKRVRKSNAGAPRGMRAALRYAWAQVGKRYVRNADGPGAFDCSGFTMQVYRRAGIRLPHSSRAQAARAYSIRRSQARPGDLVVGPGHVGVYMGRGMMIDAGNPRVGVSYRRMYGGLHLERLR